MPPAILPYRGLSVHKSPTTYIFRCPSFPDAPSLVIDRPSGNTRMVEHAVLQTKSAMSIAGILGVIRLRLGTDSTQKLAARVVG